MLLLLPPFRQSIDFSAGKLAITPHGDAAPPLPADAAATVSDLS
jgi:hypothetical protein